MVPLHYSNVWLVVLRKRSWRILLAESARQRGISAESTCVFGIRDDRGHRDLGLGHKRVIALRQGAA